MAGVRELTDESFDAEVLASDRPVIVDFCAPWCRPCEAIAPVLDQLEAEHGERVLFARMDIDSHPGAASRYGVLSLPTVILFEAGEARRAVAGARDRGHYEKAFGLSG